MKRGDRLMDLFYGGPGEFGYDKWDLRGAYIIAGVAVGSIGSFLVVAIARLVIWLSL